MSTPAARRLARVIIFTSHMEVMTAFYRDVLGLPPKPDADPDADPEAANWREFDAGGVTIALHQAQPGIDTSGQNGGHDPHKISFHCDDIAGERARLIHLGVPMGEHHRYGPLELCDGPDPDGNRFQLCNRP